MGGVADPGLRRAAQSQGRREGRRCVPVKEVDGLAKRRKLEALVGLASVVSRTQMDRLPGPSRRSAIRRCPRRRSARSSVPTIHWWSAGTWNFTGRGWRRDSPTSISCSRPLNHCSRLGRTRPGGAPRKGRYPSAEAVTERRAPVTVDDAPLGARPRHCLARRRAEPCHRRRRDRRTGGGAPDRRRPRSRRLPVPALD